MADDIDLAQERAELHLSAAIAAARARPKTHPAVSECMNLCGEAPLPGGLFCSQDCQHDAEARDAKLRRQGRG
jgi:hypothetical protein